MYFHMGLYHFPHMLYCFSHMLYHFPHILYCFPYMLYNFLSHANTRVAKLNFRCTFICFHIYIYISLSLSLFVVL